MHKLLSWVRELAPILGVNKCDVGMYISMIHLDYIIRYICICLHVCVYMYILNESVIYIYILYIVFLFISVLRSSRT